MKSIKTLIERLSISLLATLCTTPIFAQEPKGSYDIVAKVFQGSLGMTLGSSGYLWTALMVISFAVGGFFAATKHDPKAFIPAFCISAIISTITTLFI